MFFPAEKTWMQKAQGEDEKQTETEYDCEAAHVPGRAVAPTQHGRDTSGPRTHILNGLKVIL